MPWSKQKTILFTLRSSGQRFVFDDGQGRATILFSNFHFSWKLQAPSQRKKDSFR